MDIKRTAIAAVLAAAYQTGRAELSASVMSIATQCAPDVSPVTLGYIVSHESKNNPFAINVNNGKLPKVPNNWQEAAEIIRQLERDGLNYDVGLGQVNSANFKKLGVTGTDLLDGCANLRAAAVILRGCYDGAVGVVGEGQAALRRALSCYNTGNQTSGFVNGYVRQVVAQLRVPELRADSNDSMDGKKDQETRMANTEPEAQNIPTKGTADGFAVDGVYDGFAHTVPDGFSAFRNGALDEGFGVRATEDRRTSRQ